MRKFFKNLDRKLVLIVLASVFVGIVISVVTSQAATATTQSDFCMNCHDAPEFAQFRGERPHANIDCLDCHGEGFTQDKINGVGHVISTITGAHDPNNYADIEAEVPNEKCLSCHNLDNINRDPDVAAAHTGYLEDGGQCTTCHGVDLFHGDLGDYSGD